MRSNESENALSLARVDANGVGELYIISGIQLEPIATYAGDGWFRGLYFELRPGVRSIRIGQEEHYQREPGKTVRPITHLAELEQLESDDTVLFMKTLLGLLSVYYHCQTEDDVSAEQSNFLQHKLQLIHEAKARIEQDRAQLEGRQVVNF